MNDRRAMGQRRRILMSVVAAALAAASARPGRASPFKAWRKIRRVVVTENASGHSFVFADGESPNSLQLNGTRITRLWELPDVPASVPLGADAAVGAQSAYREDFRGASFYAAELPGGEHAPLIPMHKSTTIDFMVILAGRIVLVLDEREVELGPGDTIVQGSANHRWINRSAEPCLLLFVVLAAQREVATAARPRAVESVKAAPTSVVTRTVEGRYEQRRLRDDAVLGVERFRLTTHPDGTRSLVIWNDLPARGSQMNVTLSVGADFRAQEAYARYWTAGRWRGSALVRVEGRRLLLQSRSAGANGNLEAEAPEHFSLGTHPVSGDGWHLAAAQLTGNVGVGRAFILNPAGDPASPLLGQWADIPIERIGSERITVPAGSFDTQHFRLAGASDYWVTGDDWMVVKAKVRDAAYVLVSMS